MEITPASKENLAAAEPLLWNQTLNYLTSAALRCAVQLGIPDAISTSERPVTILEIASKLSIPPERSNHLYRLMRVLVCTGVFALQRDHKGREEGYVLTALSMLLTKKHSINLSTWVLGATEPALINPSLFTADWFHSTSSSPFEALHGMNLYEYNGKNPEFNQLFNDGMASDSAWVVEGLLDYLKPMLEGANSLVDVGGNNGTVAKAISKAVPHMKISVYDLPHVIADFRETDNVKPIAGNMFESIPSADVIMLKTVLGDWSDKECLAILKRCKEAITRGASGGKVIIIGLIVDDADNAAEPTLTELLTDLAIMTCLNSKERTETELKNLLLEAGFTNYKITLTPAANSRALVNSIVEAFV